MISVNVFAMGCITQDRKTLVEAELVAIIAAIVAIDAGMAGPALSGTKRFDLDSGTGRASEVFSSPLELIAARQKLAATRDRLQRELDGRLLIRAQVRR